MISLLPGGFWMNYRMIAKSLGAVFLVEAACMFPSLLIALVYNQGDAKSFQITVLVLLLTGIGLRRIKPVTGNIYARDGFAIVALGWLLVPIFGAMPFIISGAIPHIMDALFESISGFSTTGASILKNIEALPQGILFWRSFTHWMGGMGVLILILAVLPSVNANTLHIMKAESTGPTPGKFVPKIGQVAKILYIIYVTLTAIEVIFLKLGGMTLFDSFIHAFGTAGTGGFSSKNASIAAFDSLYIETVITIFMLLFGVNFTLHYKIFKGNWKSVLHDEEFRFYLITVAASTVLITMNINRNVFHSLGESIRYSVFQVSSIITTTGYATADFNIWPEFSKYILLLLMFIGGSAGSTAGGLKCIRIILLVKIIKREIYKIVHPKSVYTVKVNGKVIEEEILSGIMAFFFFFTLILGLSVLVVSLDGKGMLTSVTAVIASIGNIGPGLGMVGPIGNFADFSAISKAVLSICMIIGRLEIYPLLLLCTPAFWRRVNI